MHKANTKLFPKIKCFCYLPSTYPIFFQHVIGNRQFFFFWPYTSSGSNVMHKSRLPMLAGRHFGFS